MKLPGKKNLRRWLTWLNHRQKSTANANCVTLILLDLYTFLGGLLFPDAQICLGLSDLCCSKSGNFYPKSGYKNSKSNEILNKNLVHF